MSKQRDAAKRRTFFCKVEFTVYSAVDLGADILADALWMSGRFGFGCFKGIIWAIASKTGTNRTSQERCRATRVAADFLDFIAFCRCGTGVALHPLKILVSHLPPPLSPEVSHRNLGLKRVSRYTGVSQLQLRVSHYTVQISWAMTRRLSQLSSVALVCLLTFIVWLKQHVQHFPSMLVLAGSWQALGLPVIDFREYKHWTSAERAVSGQTS